MNCIEIILPRVYITEPAVILNTTGRYIGDCREIK